MFIGGVGTFTDLGKFNSDATSALLNFDIICLLLNYSLSITVHIRCIHIHVESSALCWFVFAVAYSP